MSQVNLDICGTLPDFGNFCVKGSPKNCNEWYDKYVGVEELMPYAHAVSAKSYHFELKRTAREKVSKIGRNEFSLISKCKTFSYNQAIQVLLEANQKSFDDSILLNTSGELCCGSSFNLLIKRNTHWITPRKESGCLEGIMVEKALKLKIAKEQLIFPEFQEDDIIVAINSLSCRQINKVNNLKLRSNFDPIYFWELLYN